MMFGKAYENLLGAFVKLMGDAPVLDDDSDESGGTLVESLEWLMAVSGGLRWYLVSVVGCDYDTAVRASNKFMEALGSDDPDACVEVVRTELVDAGFLDAQNTVAMDAALHSWEALLQFGDREASEAQAWLNGLGTGSAAER